MSDQKARLTQQVAARLEPGENVEALLVSARVYKWGFLAKEYQVVVTDRRVILLKRDAGSITTEASLFGAGLAAVDFAPDAFGKTVLTDYPREDVSLVKFHRGRMFSNLAFALPTGIVLSLQIPSTYRDDTEAIASLLRPAESGLSR